MARANAALDHDRVAFDGTQNSAVVGGAAICAGAFAFASYAPPRSLVPIAVIAGVAALAAELLAGQGFDQAWAVAVAAILGHNFPVYLRFRGGKGVATSFGALSALEPVACGVAVVGFALSLLTTRMVSVSSVVGATALLATHFARTDRPFAYENAALSVALIGLWVMLVVRHRRNFARVLAGTEPHEPCADHRPVWKDIGEDVGDAGRAIGDGFRGGGRRLRDWFRGLFH